MEVSKMALEGLNVGLIALSAGLAIGLSAIAAAIAEKAIGAAAIGAMAEKEQLFGKGLILTVIPETLVIFGLVVAILIIGMAG
ncbi:V-type ATP synthase subunit K [Candidatus Woesearchaeota archaeon]|nr:V-type ATP synthase subunit K [Candidatus Woesearchaeota archaeon]